MTLILHHQEKDLNCNGSNSFLYITATKIYHFKTKDSEIKDYALCLGTISKDVAVNNMKKVGSKGTA